MSGNYNEHPWRVVDRDRVRDEMQGLVPTPAIPDSVLRELTMLETHSRVAMASGFPQEADQARQQAEEVYRITEQHVRQRMMGLLSTPSPFWGRGFNSPVNGGSQMRSPIQYADNSATVPPSQRFAHLSEVASYPTEQDASEREFDLRRRLDEVREILGVGSRTRRINQVGVWDTGPNPSDAAPFREMRVFLGVEEVDRLNRLLSHDEVPPLVWEPDEDANTWGDVTNRRGDRGRIQLTGADGREYGTILDAAARLVRKFRLVEQ